MKKQNKVLLVIAMVIAASLSRALPHLPNFTPLGAMALFSGMLMPNRFLAILLTLGSLLVGDIIFLGGFYEGMSIVYACFALIALLGSQLGDKLSPSRIFAGSLASSVLFFVITNFAVWAGSSLYTQDFTGILRCYTLALPFFGSSLLGDLFYNAILFGGFYLIQNSARLQTEKV